jgi:hypothetical protein
MLFKRRNKKEIKVSSTEDVIGLNESYIRIPEVVAAPRTRRTLADDDLKFGPKNQEEIIQAARLVY